MNAQLRYARLIAVVFFTLAALLFLATPDTAHAADQIDLPGPDGSGSFGKTVTALPNGNIVVTDPDYDIPGGAADVGAVYLYDGATRALISMLTGSTENDKAGSDGVTVLTPLSICRSLPLLFQTT